MRGNKRTVRDHVALARPDIPQHRYQPIKIFGNIPDLCVFKSACWPTEDGKQCVFVLKTSRDEHVRFGPGVWRQ
jgi:hypothetical protein